MTEERYFRQVALLLQILPIVGEQEVFALKGGTAINLFVRDMPRLSVDIDLTYIPLESRDASIKGISSGLTAIADKVKSSITGNRIQKVPGPIKGTVGSLVVSTPQATIKIEPNHVLRGSVFPCETGILCSAAQEQFKADVQIKMLSFADLFGGKLCAALDRQHPRDLFDSKLLLEKDGITQEVRQAFIIYLASHSRPIHELLDPHHLDMRAVFESEFIGMSRTSVSYEELERAREDAVSKLRADLSNSERQFLLSVKEGAPKWNLLDLPGIEKLPGIPWKVQNIGRMDKEKHSQQLQKLRECLSL